MMREQTKHTVYSWLAQLEQDFPNVECSVNVAAEVHNPYLPALLVVRLRTLKSTYETHITAGETTYQIIRALIENTLERE